jgi:L-ascorbate metabolism protein UlaG (beta-lactamase superfamily)
LSDIDIVLITHEHADHFHIDSVQRIIANNPGAAIVSNGAVGLELEKAGIAFSKVEGTESATIMEIVLEAFDHRHEEIFEELGQVQNTGYFIDGRLFYPGDSFGNPEKSIEILALPVAGPWCKLADAIRYALSVKPMKVFPVHDGMIEEDKLGSTHGISAMVLGQHRIEFTAVKAGESVEY